MEAVVVHDPFAVDIVAAFRRLRLEPVVVVPGNIEQRYPENRHQVGKIVAPQIAA